MSNPNGADRSPIPGAQPAADPDDLSESETTGLPGLRTWRQVYLVIILIFIAYVALLAALSEVYS